MASLVAIIAALAAGFICGYYFGTRGDSSAKAAPVASSARSRPKSARSDHRHWLLVYDGELLQVAPARAEVGGVSPIGGELGKDWLLPSGAVLKTLALGSENTLHVAGIERVALKNHEQLDLYRQSVLARSAPAFKPGGDSGLGFLKSLPPVIMFLLAIYLVMQLSSLQGTIRQMTTTAETLKVLVEDGVPIPDPVVPPK